MKNILLLSAFSSLFLLSSCDKKSYTCRCDGGFSGGGTISTVEARSKNKAENKCASYNSPTGTADGVYNCKLQ
ncbi:MAG TPA: hypothetical protein VL092_09095 [Chitinophagaceae bacterium]|nr:hypothetical protein [Chitinophagaceae bacterium]